MSAITDFIYPVNPPAPCEPLTWIAAFGKIALGPDGSVTRDYMLRLPYDCDHGPIKFTQYRLAPAPEDYLAVSVAPAPFKEEINAVLASTFADFEAYAPRWLGALRILAAAEDQSFAALLQVTIDLRPQTLPADNLSGASLSLLAQGDRVVLSDYDADCLDGSVTQRYRGDLGLTDWPPTLDELNNRFDASLSILIQRARNQITAAGKVLRR